MTEVVLDTSFILSCVKKRIDFFDADRFGRVLIPLEVIGELKKISEKGKGKEKATVSLALQIIEKNKEKFRKIKLGKKFVDAGIKDYVKKKSKEERYIAVATLDRELKKSLKGKARIVSVRKNGRIEVV